MIQSYKQNPGVETHYDAIVIGSGIGSLTTAAILAKEGRKVLVLERHYTAGGFTHVFRRKGYEWDVGVHYIGEVQRKDSVVRQLFDYISDAKIEWAEMDDVYDKIVIGEKSFDFVKGVSNFKAKLVEYFPDEKKAVDDYVKLVFESTNAAPKFYMDKAMSPLLSKFVGGWMRKPFYKYSDRTTDDVLKSLTDNEELIKVLSGQYGDYGVTPKKSSFAMHASVARHYFGGGSFPVGGSSQIADNIAPTIEKTGGKVLVRAEVKQIIVENNRATGVEMADGKIFTAENIISGAGIMTTYQKLLPAETVTKHRLNEQLQTVERSVAHACLYIGLKGTPTELDLPKTNYWIYPEDADHDECVERYMDDVDQPFPMDYISFPSAKDPDFTNRHPGRSTIDIITLAPFELFAEWNGTRWMKRGEEYKELKEKIAQRLLAELYKQQPHLKGSVEYYELSTPLTTQHFVNYEKGEIYGLDATPARFRQEFLRPRTPIKNFYLTGQDIVTCGVAAALFAGVLTATAMTGSNVLKRVIKQAK